MEKAYTEVLEFLKYIPRKEYNKIPREDIEFFEKNKDKSYIYKYNKNNFSKDANAIVVSLYRKYIADEKEIKLIDDILKLNDKKVDSFAKGADDINFNNHEVKDVTIFKNENIFVKFINKIKSIFGIKR